MLREISSGLVVEQIKNVAAHEANFDFRLKYYMCRQLHYSEEYYNISCLIRVKLGFLPNEITTIYHYDYK